MTGASAKENTAKSIGGRVPERTSATSKPADKCALGIEDPPTAAVESAKIETLRCGLNAIARWLRRGWGECEDGPGVPIGTAL